MAMKKEIQDFRKKLLNLPSKELLKENVINEINKLSLTCIDILAMTRSPKVHTLIKQKVLYRKR